MLTIYLTLMPKEMINKKRRKRISFKKLQHQILKLMNFSSLVESLKISKIHQDDKIMV